MNENFVGTRLEIVRNHVLLTTRTPFYYPQIRFSIQTRIRGLDCIWFKYIYITSLFLKLNNIRFVSKNNSLMILVVSRILSARFVGILRFTYKFKVKSMIKLFGTQAVPKKKLYVKWLRLFQSEWTKRANEDVLTRLSKHQMFT